MGLVADIVSVLVQCTIILAQFAGSSTPDKGEPGRGSQQQVSSRFDQQIWEIIYWQPGSRVDFEILDRHCRAGLSFEIHAGGDSDHARLSLAMEFVPLTSARLLAFLARRKLRKRGLGLLKAFSNHLHNQQPAWD